MTSIELKSLLRRNAGFAWTAGVIAVALLTVAAAGLISSKPSWVAAQTATSTGHIIVEKVTVPGSATTTFSFDASGGAYADFTLAGDGASNDQELVAGAYSVAEADMAGWILHDVVCESSIGVTESESAGSIELDAGETVTCTFTNRQLRGGDDDDDDDTATTSSLTIVKDVSGAATTTSFDFDASWLDQDVDFSLSDGGTRTFSGLATGTYAVSEAAMANWDVDVDCTDTSATATGTGVSVILGAGENVTCTFENTFTGTTTPPPQATSTGVLIVTKTVINDSGTSTATTSDFTLQVIGGGSTTTVASGAAHRFATGTYSVVESGPTSGYTATFGGDCTSAGQVTVNAGATSTCTIVNNDNPPQQAGGQCNITIVSDDTTTVAEQGNSRADLVTSIPAVWTASIPGASWIWGDPSVGNPASSTTYTFTRDFGWISSLDSIADATLSIATDNTYAVTLNGAAVGSSSNPNNFAAGTQDSFDVRSLIVPGTNRLSITVTNDTLAGATTSDQNPAGLLFSLSIDSTDPNCREAPGSGGGGGGGRVLGSVEDDDEDDDEDRSSRRRDNDDDDEDEDDNGLVLGDLFPGNRVLGEVFPGGFPNTGEGGLVRTLASLLLIAMGLGLAAIAFRAFRKQS